MYCSPCKIPPPAPLTIREVLYRVCQHYNIPPEAALKRVGVHHDRKGRIVKVRHVTAYLCRKYVPGATLKTIGRFFGGQDHTTILSGCKAIQNYIDTGHPVGQDVAHLSETLSASKQLLVA